MKLEQAIQLIEKSKSLFANEPLQWIDLGCGSGTFTIALAHLLPTDSNIIAIDKSLQKISSTSQVDIQFLKADFEIEKLPLANLDGIIMANSLHYVKDKKTFLSRLHSYLKEKGILIIIDYDTLKANPWVPFPINMAEASSLFREMGYRKILKLGEMPSAYGRANLYALSVIF